MNHSDHYSIVTIVGPFIDQTVHNFRSPPVYNLNSANLYTFFESLECCTFRNNHPCSQRIRCSPKNLTLQDRSSKSFTALSFSRCIWPKVAESPGRCLAKSGRHWPGLSSKWPYDTNVKAIPLSVYIEFPIGDCLL